MAPQIEYTGRMPLRGHSFKLEDEIWDAFLTKAQARGVTATGVIAAAIHLYIEEEKPENAEELDKACYTYGTLRYPGPVPGGSAIAS